jgi:GT2 family glycosyltransferase
MDLSVVVCSYNRYALVTDSANAIETSSSFDPETMELIIVENTPPARRQKFSLGPHARVVICDETGLSNARNAGIAAAEGEIVAFVDDDAIVHDDWCGAVIAAFRDHPRAQVCGGRTEPSFSGETFPIWYYNELAYYLSCIDWGPKSHPLEPGQWIVGANMAFRKSVFDTIGLFDPALGRKGEASLLSNEEIAMLRKVGHEKVYYIHNMVVDHIIPDERISLGWFRKRVFWQAVSDVLAGEVHKQPAQATEDLYSIVARAPAECRGHRLLSYEPTTPESLKDQLEAVYLMGTLMSAGMPATSLKG